MRGLVAPWSVSRFEYFACHAFKALVSKHARELVADSVTDFDRAQLRARIASESIAVSAAMMLILDQRDGGGQ